MSRNDRDHIWILYVVAFILGMAIVTIAFLAAVSDKADASEKDGCFPYDQGLHNLILYSLVTHSMIIVVPPAQMQGFLEGLGDKGKGITGDAAIIIAEPAGTMLFIKRGNQLCIAKPPDIST